MNRRLAILACGALLAVGTAACTSGKSGESDTPGAPGTGAADGSAPQDGLRGRVVGADGAALAGLAITARDARGIETTVYSGADGRWQIDRLPDGEYRVLAHGAGRRAAEVVVTRASGSAPDVALRAVEDTEFLTRLPSAAYLVLLPDGDMKQEFILNCGTCHEINHRKIWKDGKPRDRQQWLAAIKMMRALDVYKVIPPDFDDERYAAWLAESLSAERIAGLKPEPAADPALAGRLRITEYPLPVPTELPHDLVVGPDRRVWVTAFWSSQMWALDPKDGAIEKFEVNSTPNVVAQVRALEFASDGRLWMLNGGTESVVRLDPKSRRFETFPVKMYAHDIDLDSQGNVWFNDYFAVRERVGRLDAKTGEVTYVDLPSAKLPESAGVPLPYGMQIDAKDRLWSTQLAANTLALLDTRSGATKLYTMPNANSGPRRTALSTDGGVWIPEFNTGRLVRFDPEAERFDVYDTGNRALGSYDLEFNPKTGDIWMSGSLNSSMLRFDPRTKRFQEFRMPTEPAYTRHIAVDAESGDVWIAYSSLPAAVPKVARIELR